jgi:hypothetical protein
MGVRTKQLYQIFLTQGFAQTESLQQKQQQPDLLAHLASIVTMLFNDPNTDKAAT